MSIGKYYNRGATGIESPYIGQIVKETDHNLVTSEEKNEMCDIPIPISEIKTGSNDKKIINLQGDKESDNTRSKMLDDLLNYTTETRKSNNPEKYGVWKLRIERDIEKIYECDSIELKQIKEALKLNFLTTSGQSEEQRQTYFNNLYERRFNKIEQLISKFKKDHVVNHERK
jgi:hypothetical protein